jgi:hypothetical protein
MSGSPRPFKCKEMERKMLPDSANEGGRSVIDVQE